MACRPTVDSLGYRPDQRQYPHLKPELFGFAVYRQYVCVGDCQSPLDKQEARPAVSAARRATVSDDNDKTSTDH